MKYWISPTSNVTKEGRGLLQVESSSTHCKYHFATPNSSWVIGQNTWQLTTWWHCWYSFQTALTLWSFNMLVRSACRVTRSLTKKLDVEILENRVTICRSVRPVECIVHGPDFTPVKTKQNWVYLRGQKLSTWFTNPVLIFLPCDPVWTVSSFYILTQRSIKADPMRSSCCKRFRTDKSIS